MERKYQSPGYLHMQMIKGVDPRVMKERIDENHPWVTDNGVYRAQAYQPTFCKLIHVNCFGL